MKLNIFDPNLSDNYSFPVKFYKDINIINKVKIFGNIKIKNNIQKQLKVIPCFRTVINPRIEKNYQKKYFLRKEKFIFAVNKIYNLNGPILIYNSNLCYIDGIVEWVNKSKYNYNVYIEFPTLLNRVGNNKNLKFEKERCNLIKSKIRKKKNIFFIYHFEKSKNRLKKLFNCKLKKVNFPLNYLKKIDKKNKSNKKIIKVSFLGEQRIHKGLKLIKKIIEPFSKNLNVRFTIHNPSNLDEINNLKKFKNTQIINKKFNIYQFVRFLNSHDVIIFPYNPERYKYSYSSTLVDTIILKKPFLVPDNTILSNFVSKINRKNFTFKNWDSKSIILGINKIIKNYAHLKKLMVVESKSFMKLLKKNSDIIKVCR